MSFSNLPERMKSYHNWVIWRLEQTKDKKDTKIPYSVKGGYASVSDPATWASYAEAVNAYQQGGFSGIGFVFTGTPFVAIDIDDCLNPATNELTAEAQDTVKVLHTYTEISQSGTGLHLVMEGHLPDGRRKNHPFEMYGNGSNRYFAMTGNIWGNIQDISDDQIAIDFIHQTYIQSADSSKEKKSNTSRSKPVTNASSPVLPDEKILKKAFSAKNGDKFARLWAGDTSDYENDDSRADFALCGMLAFWCNRDFHTIDRLFRQSKLMRPKWDEKRGSSTYGEITIQKVIDNCHEGYSAKEHSSLTQPVTEWEPVVPFDTISVPDFPVECLPKPLADFVSALAESTQTPTEMGGVLSLAVLSTAFQSRFNVEVTPDWSEPLCLYTLAIAPPAERKSPVIRALSSPIRDYEEERREQEWNEVAKNWAEKEMLESNYKKAKSLYEKAYETGEGDISVCHQKVITARQKLEAFQKIYPFQLLTDDSTQEKLVDILEKHNGSITIQSAEGGIFTTMAGKYKPRTDIDVYLKGHSDDAITLERLNRQRNYIRHPRISMMLTAQPVILESVMNNKEFEGRGLCARFIYALCRSKIGFRDVAPSPIPPHVKEDYQLFVNKILTSTQTGTLCLSDEAAKIRIEFSQKVEDLLRSQWKPISDWGGKAVGTTMRIAALFHASEEEDALITPISVDTMKRAIKVMECLSYHTIASYQMMSIDPAANDAQYLWKRICDLQVDSISKSELFDKCKGHFKTSKTMEPALQLLKERHYIRLSEARNAQKGRPPQKIEVNPLTRKSNNSKNN